MARENPSAWTWLVSEPLSGDSATLNEAAQSGATETLEEAIARVGPILEMSGYMVPNRLDILARIAESVRGMSVRDAMDYLHKIDPSLAVWVLMSLYGQGQSWPRWVKSREAPPGRGDLIYDTETGWLGRDALFYYSYLNPEEIPEHVMSFPEVRAKMDFRYIGDLVIVVNGSKVDELRYHGHIEHNGILLWRFRDLYLARSIRNLNQARRKDYAAVAAIVFATSDDSLPRSVREEIESAAWDLAPDDRETAYYVRRKPGGRRYKTT